jgi:hypothetical protein
MLLVFRGIRMFQVVLVLVTLISGVGAVLALKGFTDGNTILLLPAAFVLGLTFLWAFAAALRAPTSFVAVAIPEGRTRIRFAGFVDTVVDNKNIRGARMVRRNILGGIGVRTNFSGDVALVSTWGEAVEITLGQPIRVWLLPKVLRVKAQRLTLSVRNGQKLVDHFGSAAAASPPADPARKMNRRGPRTRKASR